MNRIMILAGTSDQALTLARRHGMPPAAWRNVGGADHLLGQRDSVLWLFGTWRDRRDAQECIAVARANGIKIFTVEDDRYVGI
jgi:hypothetical protein